MTVLRVAPRTAPTSAMPTNPLRDLESALRRRKKRKKRRRKKKAVKRTPPKPTPPPKPKVAVLDARALLVATRFTGGWTPALGTEITQAGGIDSWFARQLDPTLVSDLQYTTTGTWWSSNLADPLTTVARHKAGTEFLWQADMHYQCWSLVRRIGAQRQVLETMANFWEHHFHVPTDGSQSSPYRASYGRTIRSHALGKFSDLLLAASTHPCMGAYLGNATSTKSAPNENQGRELLELHTVGRDAGFTEDDVKSSARILTGYRVRVWDTWTWAYDPSSHWTGAVKVLGFSHPNTSPDGRAVTAAYLDYLARHPATAKRICRKLAVHFVSDKPSDALVDHLAAVYLANDTAIAPVLKALIGSSEFRASAGAKTRTPEEDVVATYRALGVTVARPTKDDAAANAILWQTNHVGQTPFGWPRPDGRPDTADAWTSVSRILGSFEMHYSMCGGWWPTAGATYRTPASWLPSASVRFDALVDHLARSILGRASTASLLKVATQATGIAAGTVITREHALVKWEMPRLLTVFLDNPLHLGR